MVPRLPSVYDILFLVHNRIVSLHQNEKKLYYLIICLSNGRTFSVVFILGQESSSRETVANADAALAIS